MILHLCAGVLPARRWTGNPGDWNVPKMRPRRPRHSEPICLEQRESLVVLALPLLWPHLDYRRTPRQRPPVNSRTRCSQIRYRSV